jgi:hypothetical protein
VNTEARCLVYPSTEFDVLSSSNVHQRSAGTYDAVVPGAVASATRLLVCCALLGQTPPPSTYSRLVRCHR